jgi:hypothetical protein
VDGVHVRAVAQQVGELGAHGPGQVRVGQGGAQTLGERQGVNDVAERGKFDEQYAAQPCGVGDGRGRGAIIAAIVSPGITGAPARPSD